jgi:ABC-type lipoprotein release transport system permease subunit
MNLYLKLAWRNVWRHRRRTLIVMLAIGLGLALMMLYDGVVGGFNQAIYGNAIRILGANIQVHAPGYNESAGQKPLLVVENASDVVQAAKAQPQVVAATQRINTTGLASSREGAFAVSIVGIEPDQELPVSLVAQHVTGGRYLSPNDGDVVLIGKGLADAMGVTVGDKITLVGRAPHEQMRKRTMTVGGIYDVGMRDIEKRAVYMSLSEAKSLYGLEGPTEVAISLYKIGEEGAVINAMKPAVGNVEMETWATLFPELEDALSRKGGVMDVFSVIILIIAGIGILNLLLMAVFERTREIGLLGALGLKPRQISWMFVLEGAIMGLLGIVLGLGLGLAINGLLGQTGIDMTKFTGLTDYMALIEGKIYPTLGIDKFAQRAITVLVIAVLASLYPAREAARNEPAKALHFV